MRVIIDASPLLVRSAGVKNYLYYWIQHLRQTAGPREIATLPALDLRSSLTHESSIAGRLRTVRGLATLALANYTPLPVMDLAARGADIFHASVLVRRPPSRVRLTGTVYDVTCFLMPELHPVANRRADASFANLARRADGLIAISQCTKDDAVRVLGLSPEKITVIYPGVADAFFECPAAEIDMARRHYQLNRPFVLFVGTIEPRKNLDTLLDAWEALPVGLREHHDLVIAGPVGWAGERTVTRLTGIRYLGYVPERHLAPLTAAATAFAYPSLYEGFGFPVAQAMAAGVPVITSNVSSLPEVAGDAALLVDPRSQSELRSALARVLTSPDLRISMAASGRQSAKRFRWPECARRSLEFFRDLLG